MTPRKSSSASARFERHRNRAKMVLVAHMRGLGHTQTEAAECAGCARRTVASWEASDLWPEAQREARSQWGQQVDAAARRTLLRTIEEGDGNLALKYLERTDPELAPPQLRHDLTSAGEPLMAWVLTSADDDGRDED